MSRRIAANGRSIPGFLYVGVSQESREAERVLRRWRIRFVRFDVKDRREDTVDNPKPPCLMTGQGRFSGVESIRKYAERFGERRAS